MRRIEELDLGGRIGRIARVILRPMTRRGRRLHGLWGAAVAIAIAAGCAGQAPSAGPTVGPATPAVPTVPPSPASTQPVWAPEGMSADDAWTLVELVAAELVERGYDPVFQDDGSFTVPLTPDDEVVIGLENLAAKVAAADVAEWPEIVRDHLERGLAAYEGGGDDTSDYGTVRDRLRLVAHDSLYLAPEDLSDLVSTKVIGDLWLMLVVDSDDHIQLVWKSDVESWDVSMTEVYVDALIRTLDDSDPAIEAISDDPSVQLVVDDIYTATLLFGMERLVEEPAPDGILVFIPMRDELVYHVIDGDSVVHVLEALGGIAVDGYETGPYPVSDDAYWWLDGVVTPIPYEAGSYTIPDEMAEHLGIPLGTTVPTDRPG